MLEYSAKRCENGREVSVGAIDRTHSRSLVKYGTVISTLRGIAMSRALQVLFISVAVLAGIAATAGGAGNVIETNPENFAGILSEAGPGDTLLLADGEYTGRYRISTSGTEDAPIVIKAAGEGAVFRDAITISDASWVVLDGLRTSGSIRLNRVTHCAVRNCLVEGVAWRGIGIYVGSYITIENNEVCYVRQNHGLHILGPCDHITIRGNYVHDNPSNGIQVNGYPEVHPFDGVVKDCVIENNIFAYCGGVEGGAAINCTNMQDTIIRNNLLYKNLAGGIVIYEDELEIPALGNRGNKIVGNTVYYNKGEGRWSFKLRNTCVDHYVHNNIFYGGQFGTVSVGAPAFEGLDMDNNLIFSHEGETLLGEVYTVDDEDNFTYSVEEWQDKGYDTKSVFGAGPGFVSVARDDYRLRAGSPAADMGADLSQLCAEDMAGASRPKGKGWDAGALETYAPVTIAAAEGLLIGEKIATPETLPSVIAEARPGDTIVLEDGEYTNGLAGWRLVGTEGAPITIKARSKKAIFTRMVDLADAEWVILKGLTIRATQDPIGLHAQGSRNCTITGCDIADTKGRYGIQIDRCSRMTIENSAVCSTAQGHGISILGDSDDCVISHNLVAGNAGAGIYLDPWTSPGSAISGAMVEGNEIAANGGGIGGAAINCSNVQDSTFRNNVLYGNKAGGIAFFKAPPDMPGQAVSPDSMRNKVVCNTVVFEKGEGRWAFKLRDKCAGFFVHDNIFYGGAFGTVSVSKESMEGLSMDNNIITTYPGQLLLGESYKEDAEEGFLYLISQWRELGFDGNSRFYTEPGFVSQEKNDYHLERKSPAVDAGAALGDICDIDKDGAVRPQGKTWDCGAYEYKR